MPRILIMDDYPPVLEMLACLLSSAGHEVLTADNGADGIQLAMQQEVDLAMVDIDMPGMDGYQVCALLKAEPALRSIPVIMMTGRSFPGAEQKALRQGAVALIAKPFEHRSLLEMVASLAKEQAAQ